MNDSKTDASDQSPAVRAEEERVPPRSLLEYLRGKASGALYVDSLDKGVAPRLSDTLRAEGVAAVQDEPRLMSRLPDLMRAAVSIKTPQGMKRDLLGFGADVIRTLLPEQESWGRRAEAGAEGLLEPLARHLRRTREQHDKHATAQAEALLLAGLVIATERGDFDEMGALQTLYAGLHPRSETPSDVQRQFRRTLGRSPIRNVEAFALLRRLIGTEFDTARLRQRQALQELQDARDRLRLSQEESRLNAQRVRSLEEQLSQLQLKLAEASGSIASTREGAAHDRFELKGSVRGLIEGKLKPYLIEALEAIEEEPYFVSTARERLEMIRDELEGSLVWLSR